MLQATQPEASGGKAVSIHTLCQRINPFGFCRAGTKAPDFGGALCINNLFDSLPTGSRWASHDSPAHINLDPFLLPAGVHEPEQDRTLPVTLCYHDGRKLPTVHGVTAQHIATYKEWSSAIARIADLGEDEQLVLVLLKRNKFACFPNEDDKIDSYYLQRLCVSKKYNLAAFCVPKSPHVAVIHTVQKEQSDMGECTSLPVLVPMKQEWVVGKTLF